MTLDFQHRSQAGPASLLVGLDGLSPSSVCLKKCQCVDINLPSAYCMKVVQLKSFEIVTKMLSANQ